MPGPGDTSKLQFTIEAEPNSLRTFADTLKDLFGMASKAPQAGGGKPWYERFQDAMTKSQALVKDMTKSFEELTKAQ